MKIILVGAAGKMGKEVAAAARSRGDEIVCAVDIAGGYIEDIGEFDEKADVIIDFSSPSSVKSVIGYAIKTKTPAVIATTGHDAEQKKSIISAGETVPVFYSANLSTGIAALIGYIKSALLYFKDAQVEIVETHHADKADSPSGTALFIAKKLGLRPVFARRGKRRAGEVGISSVRYGNVFGEHKVIVYSRGQTLTFTHAADSRAVFADGALNAARFISGKTNGVFDITDIINET